MTKTLLLVDDEPNILHALSRLLDNAGYHVLSANSGKEALDLLSREKISVIIADQRMPYMTGSELLAQVRTLYPETVRMILSAYADFNAVQDAINNGAIYKFLSKPWDNESLLIHVRDAFNQYERGQIEKENEQALLDLMYLDKLTDQQLALETALHDALQKQEFVLYYQPSVDIESGKMIGAEALLRWQHPERGLLLPEQFISLCEKTGLIIDIGAWVLRQACEQAKRWCDAGYPNFCVAVNLSQRQFNDSKLLDLIQDILKNTGISDKNLELEITESLLMQNVEHNIFLLKSLKNLGLKLTLDDFGTGYSSLSYLKQFPFDILKIDKSFINDIAISKDSETIVTAIITMAKSLGLTIIAEGVETQEQLTILKEKQCDVIQGYFFSKPVPSEEIDTLFQKQGFVNDIT